MASADATPTEKAETVLLVAVCTGPRCAAIRRLPQPPGIVQAPPGRSTSEALLRGAVRGRPSAVLVSTGCLGPCHQACVAVIGHGHAASGHFSWHGPPLALGPVELPEPARDLADWISHTAPERATLPASLRPVHAAQV